MADHIRAVLATLLIVGFAPGQDRPGRTLGSNRDGYPARFDASKVGDASDFVYVVSSVGALTTLGPDDVGPTPSELAAMQGDPFFAGVSSATRTPRGRSEQSLIAFPGGACPLSGMSTLLLVGRDSAGCGRMEVWSWSSGTLILADFALYPGMDLGGVAFDPNAGRMFLLDALSGQIFDATWAPGSSLPSQASLTSFASYSDVAAVGAKEDLAIRFVQGGQGQAPIGGALFVGVWFKEFGRGVFLDRIGGALQVNAGIWFRPFEGLGPSIACESVSEGGVTVQVKGDEGSQVQVFRLLDGALLGSAVVPTQSDGTATVALTQALQIGQVIEARYSTAPGLFPGSCEVVARYGVPESTSWGLSFLPRTGELDARIGNDHFTINARVVLSPPPSPWLDLASVVWMLGATRDSLLGDPLLLDPVDGDGTVLDPILVVPAGGFVYSDGYGSVGISIPIPNSPSLVDLVLLSQFAANDTTWVRFSEAIGFVIRG